MSPEKIQRSPENPQEIERKRLGSEAIGIGSKLLENPNDAVAEDAARKLRIIADALEQPAPAETPKPRTYRSHEPPGPDQGVERG